MIRHRAPLLETGISQNVELAASAVSIVVLVALEGEEGVLENANVAGERNADVVKRRIAVDPSISALDVGSGF